MYRLRGVFQSDYFEIAKGSTVYSCYALNTNLHAFARQS